MPCVALYTGDDKWYRAIIEDIPGKKQVNVRYVDYGNKERLWYKQLYKITEDFLKLPAQAIKCRLQDINPIGNNWPENAADHMATICDGKDLKAFFHTCENDECLVSLMVCTQEPEDIGEQLMELGVAEAPENFKIHYQKNQALRFMLAGEMMQNQRQGRSKRTLQQLRQMQAPVLKPGAVCAGKRCVLVEFLTTLSVCRIQIRLASQAGIFRDLQNQLDEELNQISQPTQFKPALGEVCAIKMTHAPFCARAKVIKYDLDSIQVLMVDCGGMEWVKYSQVFPLPERLASFKNLALMVSLAGIAPPMGKSGWPGITFDRLKEELSTRSNLYMKRKGRSVLDPELGVKVMPVELGWMQEEVGGPFEPNTVLTFSINELLIECGVALPAKSVQPDNSNVAEKSTLADSTCTLTYERALSCEDFCLQEAESLSILSMLVDQEKMPCDTKENMYEKLKEWPASPLPASTTFNAIPSYIDYEGIIYLQPVANTRNIELMRESQTMQFTGTVATDEDLCWSPGDPVVAMFHLDKKWYRATVLQREEDGNVKVQFVDYGNEETVVFNQLRQTITFSHIPIQCHRAVLHGIVPNSLSGKWETKLLDFIHSTIVEKECRIQVIEKPKEDGLLKVNLEILDVAIDLSSLLADKMKVCRRLSKFESQFEYEDSVDVVVESDISLDSVLDLSLPVPALKLPRDPSEIFPIKVTAIKDPSHVYITPEFLGTGPLSATQKLAEESFKANSSFINQAACDIKTYSVVSNPVIGEMYLGKSLRGEWCRVQVKNIDPTGITVLYIDIGNVERIPQNWLVMCPSEGKKIPANAICVNLHCVEPRDGPHAPWDEDALKCISSCFMHSADKKFYAVVKEEGTPPVVEIYSVDEHGTRTLAYADAISKGHIVLGEQVKE
ncbi:RING finger protein 17-like [Penaeus chinensis]|uniref:RING finger protein 17-like n=1 Tax=Penaeus chinensis TaxID=139456 RepID=UPI001FB6343A|nr:RING finger protein 17-like [Penaeus chinensis]